MVFGIPRYFDQTQLTSYTVYCKSFEVEKFRGFRGSIGKRETFSVNLFRFDNRVLKMAGHGPGLLRFFKPCRKNPCDLPLPDLSGSLSEKVDSIRSPIEEANKEVTGTVQYSGCGRKVKFPTNW